MIPGQLRNNADSNTFQNIPKIRSSKYANNAIKMREELANGSVPWQMDYARRTGQG